MATWKQIEQRRELRLWIKEIVMPVVFTAGAAMTIPEVRTYVTEQYGKAKTWVKTKIDNCKKKD